VAVAEWRALRADFQRCRESLARARRDNDRLLHEVRAYRKVRLLFIKAAIAPAPHHGGSTRALYPRRSKSRARPPTPLPTLLPHCAWQLVDEQRQELATSRQRSSEFERLQSRLAASEKASAR
jgi:hypothetical protein